MNGIDRLLGALDVRARNFSIIRLEPGDTLAPAARDETPTFYVLQGTALLTAPGLGDVAIGPGGFAVFPRGAATIVQSSQSSGRLVFAAGGVLATIAGGAGLFDALTQPIALDFGIRLHESFNLLAAELATPAVGSQALVDGVLRQALILMIRSRSEAIACPWIVAMTEPRLAPAIAAMLDHSADPLTLEDLARLSGMSRTAFTARFSAAFGLSPIEFLKHVRLGQAARLLAGTDIPVKRIARTVGYESRSYFSRAFRKRYALDPTDFRARASAAPCC